MMLKKGIQVKIIAGKDKGKTGEILEINRKLQKIKVKSINMIKRHTKPTKENKGGIVSKESFIHQSNVKNIDSLRRKQIAQYIKSKNLKLIEGIKFLDKSEKNLSEINKKIIKNNNYIFNKKTETEVKNWINNKIILVTGCGGTIGKELCFQILKNKVKFLVCLDNDEHRISVFNQQISSYSNDKVFTKIIYNFADSRIRFSHTLSLGT